MSANSSNLKLVLHSRELAELRIANAKLDNDTLPFLEERPHRCIIGRLHVTRLSANVAMIGDLRPKQGP
jgi:hypothetical protein